MYAQLRYHYRIDPEDLSDQDLIKLWSEYVWAKMREREYYLGILREVVSEIFGK